MQCVRAQTRQVATRDVWRMDPTTGLPVSRIGCVFSGAAGAAGVTGAARTTETVLFDGSTSVWSSVTDAEAACSPTVVTVVHRITCATYGGLSQSRLQWTTPALEVQPDPRLAYDLS